MTNDLRTTLAQPKQKPVAWGLPNFEDPIRRKQALLKVDLKIPHDSAFPQFWVPLYTAPPKREWQGLTDEESQELLVKAAHHKDPEYCTAPEMAVEFGRLASELLKEKNA